MSVWASIRRREGHDHPGNTVRRSLNSKLFDLASRVGFLHAASARITSSAGPTSAGAETIRKFVNTNPNFHYLMGNTDLWRLAISTGYNVFTFVNNVPAKSYA